MTTTGLRHVLVPLDGSPFGEQALPVGAAIARKADAALHLASVLEPAPVLVLSPELPVAAEPVQPASVVAASDYLDLIAAATHDAQGRQPITAVLRGPAADALREHVEEHGIDLIVMTTHARRGIARWWLGSVAESLVRQVRVPVLLLHPRDPPQATEFRRILVALDGELDEQVLDAARSLGRLDPPARYLLIRVVEPAIPLFTPLAAYPAHLSRSHYERAEADARQALEGVAERLRAEGHEAVPRVVVGRGVSDQVLELAAEFAPDIIVVGTHPAHGVERALLRSVADQVVRRTTLPVLVAPGR